MSEAVASAVPQFPDSSPDLSSEEAARVVSHLSHELRQPLSAIETIAYYLELISLRDDERGLEQIGKIRRLVDQMNWMLTDATQYMQATSSSPQVIEFHEMLSAAVADQARVSEAPIRSSLCDEPAFVCLDPSQARHMAHSLLAVLCEMAAPGESVFVRTEMQASELRLSVSAPKLRLPESTLEGLFAPFAPQLPTGMGLGLASAKKIVEDNGGRVEAHSSEETGASFEAWLPLAT